MDLTPFFAHGIVLHPGMSGKSCGQHKKCAVHEEKNSGQESNVLTGTRNHVLFSSSCNGGRKCPQSVLVMCVLCSGVTQALHSIPTSFFLFVEDIVDPPCNPQFTLELEDNRWSLSASGSQAFTGKNSSLMKILRGFSPKEDARCQEQSIRGFTHIGDIGTTFAPRLLQWFHFC